jgi:hypothetical protein
MESIVALARGQDGNRTGQWISFWGASDLSDVQFENGDLTFKWSVEGFDGQTRTSSFSGRIEDGALTGTLSGDRGESAVKGERIARVPRAAGQWEMKYRIGEQDVTSILKVTAADDQTLAGEWISEWGEHKITEISAQRNDLAFKRTSQFGDNEIETAFTGTMDRNQTLTGTMSSEMGEIQVAGTRVGADAVGTWTLDLESERGARKQRLRVNPDLSALYGSTQVDAVTVDGNQISFPMKLEFGDQPFEMTFKGTVDGDALTGEVTSDRGTRVVKGTRVAMRGFGARAPQ